jgi:hypothetical protein
MKIDNSIGYIPVDIISKIAETESESREIEIKRTETVPNYYL